VLGYEHSYCSVVLVTGWVYAADTSQWSGVRELKKGDRVGVIQADMKRVEGRFESATEDAGRSGPTFEMNRTGRIPV
jgi:hypothetical protein